MRTLAGCPLCMEMVWVDGVDARGDYGDGVIEEHETEEGFACAANDLTYDEAWEQR
jgi:hypothetical protein